MQSEREGSLTSTERAMIHNVVDFRNVKASDVMVPIEKASPCGRTLPIDETLSLSAAAGVDRLPVISPEVRPSASSTSSISSSTKRGESLANYTRRIVTATEDEPAYRIVQRLRAARLGLAAVVDSRNA